MSEEIKEYLKRVDELELKLTDEDKDTYQWLIFGYNECSRLLNEKEQENKQLKDNWNKLKDYIKDRKVCTIYDDFCRQILNKMQELEGNNE